MAENRREYGKEIINGELVINGSLSFGENASVTGLPMAAATTEKLGAVKMAANVAEAAGDAPTKAEFKALLDALIEAGLMAEPETPVVDPGQSPEG